MTIRITNILYFNKRFNEKPQGKQCGWVQKSLIETEIAIEDLADALCHGGHHLSQEF